jgi:hypothetical protein
VLAARLYSRYFITKAPGIDDLLIVLGAAFGIALSVITIIGNNTYHSGYHVWDIPLSLAPGSRLNSWIGQWLYLWATGCIKISLLLFIRRLSVSFNRPFFWAVWAGIGYNVAQILAFSIALLTICQPTSAYWLSFNLKWLIEHNGNRHCTYEGWSLTMSGIFSIIGDLYATLLPCLLVMNLRMPRQTKVAVALLFAAGFAVVGVGIGRTVMINRVVEHDYDYTWILWDAWIWSITELWTGLIVASAPSLKPFFNKVLFEPLTSVIKSSTFSAWRHRTTSVNDVRPSSHNGTSWSFMQNDKPSRQTTETATSRTENSERMFTFQNHEMKWPVPPISVDIEKGLHDTSPSTPIMPPVPAMDGFRYVGGGRCWSTVGPPQRSSSRLSRNVASKRGSGFREGIGHRYFRSTASSSSGPGSPAESQRHSSCGHSRISSTNTDIYCSTPISPHLETNNEQDKREQQVGHALSIDRTVEWAIVNEEEFCARQ